MSNPAVVVLARLVRDAKAAEKIADSWKMSTLEKRQLLWTVEQYWNVNNIPALKGMIAVQGIDREWIYDLLRSHERYESLEILKAWETPVFPINGNDLIELGYEPGPRIGVLLKRWKDVWSQGDYKATRDELLTYLR